MQAKSEKADCDVLWQTQGKNIAIKIYMAIQSYQLANTIAYINELQDKAKIMEAERERFGSISNDGSVLEANSRLKNKNQEKKALANVDIQDVQDEAIVRVRCLLTIILFQK